MISRVETGDDKQGEEEESRVYRRVLEERARLLQFHMKFGHCCLFIGMVHHCMQVAIYSMIKDFKCKFKYIYGETLHNVYVACGRIYGYIRGSKYVVRIFKK
jgi:hypothetical protein